MQTHPGVAAGMFEALYNIGVNIRMIGTSEIRVTVLVDEKDVDKAMRAAHEQIYRGLIAFRFYSLCQLSLIRIRHQALHAFDLDRKSRIISLDRSNPAFLCDSICSE